MMVDSLQAPRRPGFRATARIPAATRARHHQEKRSPGNAGSDTDAVILPGQDNIEEREGTK